MRMHRPSKRSKTTANRSFLRPLTLFVDKERGKTDNAGSKYKYNGRNTEIKKSASRHSAERHGKNRHVTRGLLHLFEHFECRRGNEIDNTDLNTAESGTDYRDLPKSLIEERHGVHYNKRRSTNADSCDSRAEKALELMIDTYKNGGKVLVCGNGGSAADSEHIVGELMKGFLSARTVTDADIPEDLRDAFTPYYRPDEKTETYVKAADKFSALIKCREELNLGNKEFESAGLTSLFLPNGITSLNSEGFRGNYSLETLGIPVSVTSLGFLHDDLHNDEKESFNLTIRYGGTKAQWNTLAANSYFQTQPGFYLTIECTDGTLEDVFIQ